MLNFIIIDSVCGQFTLTFENDEYVDFLVLKQTCTHNSWQHMKNETKCLLPVLSTSADSQDDSKYIEEDKPLEAYKLQNGGIIFVYYVDLGEQLSNSQADLK